MSSVSIWKIGLRCLGFQVNIMQSLTSIACTDGTVRSLNPAMDRDTSSDSAEQSELPVKIKEEPRDDIKDYAETTMNELLGLYGYDKFDRQDTEHLNLERYTVSSTPDTVQGLDDIQRENTSDESSDSRSLVQSRRGLANGETALAAQHRNLVSALNKRLSHDSGGLDGSSVPSGYIICAWCQKPGIKLFTLKTVNGAKVFCSELCFTQCRRASFKKNKICDWCKHVRHTVNYVDFQDGEQQLQFCSEKCLNQYKMNIFCQETQEHLQQMETSVSPTDVQEKQILITPDLWLQEDIARQNKKSKLEKKEKESVCSGGKTKDFRDAKSPEIKPIPVSSTAERTSEEKLHKDKLKRNYKEPVLASSPGTINSSSSQHAGSHFTPPMYHPPPASLQNWFPPPQLFSSLGPGFPTFGAMHPMMYAGLFSPQGNSPHVGNDASRPHSQHITSTPEVPQSMTNGMNMPRQSPTPCAPRIQYPVTWPHNLPFIPMHHATQDQNRHHSGSQTGLNLLQGFGVPPVTVMLPFPFLFPLPIPIPVPIPVPMKSEKFEKLLNLSSNCNKDKKDTDIPPAAHVVEPKQEKNSFNKISGHFEVSSNRPQQHNIPRDCINCVSCHSAKTNEILSRPSSVTSIKSDSHASVTEVSTKRSLTPASVNSIESFKRVRHESVNSSYSLNDEVIDLSKDSSRESCKDLTSTHSLSENQPHTPETCAPDTNVRLRVPKIHIVSTPNDPPLSQQLPLPPTDHAYSLRRGLILDAPSVRKRSKSPSPERHSYIRSIPRDIMEARRCLRTRIKSK